MIRILLILLALLQPAPIYFSAYWDGSASATVSWHQTARGCLYRESAIGEQVFIGCYERLNATLIVTFGHSGPLSGDLRPMPGDVFVLVTNGTTARARLIGRAQYLAAFRA